MAAWYRRVAVVFDKWQILTMDTTLDTISWDHGRQEEGISLRSLDSTVRERYVPSLSIPLRLYNRVPPEWVRLIDKIQFRKLSDFRTDGPRHLHF